MTEDRSPSGDAPPATAPVAPPLVPEEACPFLIAAAGAYRMSMPDREHRCSAFVPATSLALTKQGRLCLTANHPGCATYLASTSARQARVGTGERLPRAGRWGLARTMPVVQEVGGLRATIGALIADRRTWPAIPAVLLATLLLALGLSGSWGQTPITAIGSPKPTTRPTPSLRATAPASPAPSAVPSAPPTASPPSATPEPSVAPTAVPTAPPAYTIYRIKSGDTLSWIATRYHTTVAAIEALNGITDPRSLRAGQVIKIPKA